MKKLLLSILIVANYLSQAQSWSKVSVNFDSLWTSSVYYYNKGDTLAYYGSTTGTGALDAKRFYISTDGGYNFTRDLTKLDRIGYEAFYSLKLNNMFIGFKNTPNIGSYNYQGVNNWPQLISQLYGVWGEINSGTIFCGSYVFNLPNTTTPIGNIAGTPSNMRATFNKGSRVFLGGTTIKYFDNATYTTVSTASINPVIPNGEVFRFFEGINNELFAVINYGNDYLYKSIDNGVTWNRITTTYNGSNILNSAFTIGTANGHIFYLSTNGNGSATVYRSIDGGLTASLFNTGLPTNGLNIGPNSKLLVNGNKVWYHLKAANNTDFFRTDTIISGLYVFNDVVSVKENTNQRINFSIYPNPAKEILHIKYETSNYDSIEIKITNLLGETVLTEKATSNNLSVKTNNLNSGVYFVTITNKGAQSTQKIIIE
ncbi:MAG: T9SS type A sorting domain-containing protein [Bacteroidia bacterium]|nr:T9SS type A sorting domain-containing protein [Bacteroidia bacterium]